MADQSFNCNLMTQRPAKVVTKKVGTNNARIVRAGQIPALKIDSPKQIPSNYQNVYKKPPTKNETPVKPITRTTYGRTPLPQQKSPISPHLKIEERTPTSYRKQDQYLGGATPIRCKCKKHNPPQPSSQQKQYRQVSPAAVRSLDPRVDKVLRDSGLSQYSSLMEKEEIDFAVFQLLMYKDLYKLGIATKDIPSFLATIKKFKK